MLAAILLMMFVGDIADPTQSTARPDSPPAVAQQTAEQPWPPEGVYRAGKDVPVPRPSSDSPRPSYMADALRANVQGLVVLEAIVLPDGSVGEVRVKRSLDQRYGLDNEAVATLKKWRFVAGMKDGVAVPVVIEVEMSFTIRTKGRR